MVGRQLPKLNVAGSSPVSRSSRGQVRLAAGKVAIARLQENLGGAFSAAAESTALYGAALMAGGIAAVISSVVISMLIVAGVTAGAL